MLTVPVFFSSMILKWAPVGYLLGIKKKHKNEWESFTPCNILQKRCSKIKRPPASSLGDPLFQECASPGALLPYKNLYSAGWNEPWTRTPSLLRTLWKTLALVSRLSCHAPRAFAILAKIRIWTGPYYQSLEPYKLASSWTQTKHDFHYRPLHSFEIRHFPPFSILLCWSGDHSFMRQFS